MAADHIVIGTSMYNFSIPAVLLAGGTTAIDTGKATLPEFAAQFAPDVSAAARA